MAAAATLPRRAGDVSARVGGEEFCVLLPYTTPPAAQAFDARLRAELAAKANTAGLPWALDFSCGHALYRHIGRVAESLMAAPTPRLYRPRTAARGQLVLYEATPAA